MRHGMLALCGVILTGWFALAQSSGRPFYVGAPVEIKNVPLDVSKSMRTNSNLTKPLGATTNKSPIHSFNLGSMFSTPQLPTWPPPSTTTPILSQKQNIFQPTLPKGKGPLDGGKVVKTGGPLQPK